MVRSRPHRILGLLLYSAVTAGLVVNEFLHPLRRVVIARLGRHVDLKLLVIFACFLVIDFPGMAILGLGYCTSRFTRSNGLSRRRNMTGQQSLP